VIQAWCLRAVAGGTSTEEQARCATARKAPLRGLTEIRRVIGRLDQVKPGNDGLELRA